MQIKFRDINNSDLYSMNYNQYKELLTTKYNYKTPADKKKAFIKFRMNGIRSVIFSLQCDADNASKPYIMGLDNFSTKDCPFGENLINK